MSELGPSGSTMLAIDPTMPSGQGGAVPAAAHTSARASSANARFVAITAGQPPGTSEPT
jgi:hypothetical protein